MKTSLFKFFQPKMESIQNVSPAYISSFNLIHVDESITDLYEEFLYWFEKLSKAQAFFFAYEKILKVLYHYIFRELTYFLLKTSPNVN
jgi:hypothetical protein